MSNLKGSTFEKQIRDANFRLSAFAQKRRGDHLTHSDGLAKTRNGIWKDLKDFFEKEGCTGKLNLLITEENMEKFLKEKIGQLNGSEAKYVSSLSSLVKGLREVNITVKLSERFFDRFRQLAREQRDTGKKNDENRYIQSAHDYIRQIEEEAAKVYAEVLLSTGLRRTEAHEVMLAIQNVAGDISEDTQEVEKMTFRAAPNEEVEINGLVGKGGRLYQFPKYISMSLFRRIQNLEKIPSSSKLNRDLGPNKSHDFRFTFARDYYTRAKEAGKSETEALAMTSQELGHNRLAMTRYYLKRSQK